MSRSKLFVLAGVVCLTLVGAAHAQGQTTAEAETSPTTASGSATATVVPRLMKFGSTLRDNAGKPITGPVEVSFALYSTDSGGDPLWLETQSVQADDQGRYTALIGVMHSDGLPMDLFVSGEARWLGVQIANEPEQKPRVLLLSVPYALKAADAETLGGLPASAFVVAPVPQAGSAGASTPTSGPSSRSGAATPRKGSSGHKAAPCSSVTSDGTATANSITMFTTSCNIESSVITQSSGNIGIGTASPTSPLSVTASGAPLPPQPAVLALGAPAGVVPFRMLQNVPGSSTPALIDLETADGKLAQLSAGGTGIFQINAVTGNSMAFATNGFTPRMFINTSGNVGIGTTSPSSPLSVVLSGAPLPPQPAVLALGAPAGVVPFRMLQNVPGSSTPALIDLETADGKLAQLSAGGTGIFQINALTGNAMAFATNGFTPRMYIDTSGNVGIGTTTPGAMLEVNGAAKFDQPVTFADGQTITGGDLALPTTTGSGAGVITLGGLPFAHAYGLDNTFLGQNSGNFTLTGDENTGVGNYALYANTGGNVNTAVGASALYTNSSGVGNTAVGASALTVSSTSNYNTAVGFEALQTNCYQMPSSCGAANNTGVGFLAGATSTFGNGNISGTNDTFIGSNSGPGTSIQLNNATAFGANAVVSESNALVLGSINGVNGATSSVDVGIGTATPAAPLDAEGNNTSEIVNVVQSGTGNGLVATAAGKGTAGLFVNTGGGHLITGANCVSCGQVFQFDNNGSLSIGSSGSFSVNGTSGNIYTAGSLQVSGAVTTNGITVNGSAGISGGNLTVSNTANINALNVTGGTPAAFAGGITVTGSNNTTVTPLLSVTSTQQSSFAGGLTIGGTVGIMGNLNVSGAISAGTKDFKIDDPFDPQNKYLYHASIESSEMMNIYSGNSTLDASGQAMVDLPDWFEALNGDFRYQLTAIGGPAPGLYIAQKIQGNRFRIAGGAPGQEVSWQVTGVRHDAFALAHPLLVEVDKTESERGAHKP